MAALYAAWIALYALMAVSTWIVEMILQWSEVDVQSDGVRRKHERHYNDVGNHDEHCDKLYHSEFEAQ